MSMQGAGAHAAHRRRERAAGVPGWPQGQRPVQPCARHQDCDGASTPLPTHATRAATAVAAPLKPAQRYAHHFGSIHALTRALAVRTPRLCCSPEPQLALKHRRNKNGGQRIVVFVGSPIEVKDNVLKKLGISLRRSNVGGWPWRPWDPQPSLTAVSAAVRQISLDVIGLGEHESNSSKIQVLVDAANTDENNW